jgi:TNF receptor-associated protein 1
LHVLYSLEYDRYAHPKYMNMSLFRSDRSLVSAETSSIDLDSESSKVAEEDEKKDEGSSADESGELSAEKKKLSDDEAADFCAWMTSVLGSKVKSVKVSKRLSDSPALVTDHESGALRRMMKMVVSNCLVHPHHLLTRHRYIVLMRCLSA